VDELMTQYAVRNSGFVVLNGAGGGTVIPGTVSPNGIPSVANVPNPGVNVGTGTTRPTGAQYVTWESLNPSNTLSFKQVLNAVPSGKILTLPAGTFTIGSDFNDSEVTSCFVPSNVGGIWGSGVGVTILQMAPNSSTKGSMVAGIAAFDTNPCEMMRVVHSNFVLKNLQINGTSQGHAYGGVQIGDGSVQYQTGVVIDTVKIVGVPGTSNFPPGETFMMDLNWNDAAQILNCEFDGAGVSGANLGFNHCKNSYVADTYTHDSGHSHGIAWWRCTGAETLRVRSENNGRGSISSSNFGACLNYEQTDGAILNSGLTVKRGAALGNGGLHIHYLNNDGTHTGTTSLTVNGVTHDAGPDAGGCFSMYEWTEVPVTVIKNGVTLSRRTSGAGNPNTEYYTYT
jgi:hypothetical protein